MGTHARGQSHARSRSWVQVLLCKQVGRLCSTQTTAQLPRQPPPAPISTPPKPSSCAPALMAGTGRSPPTAPWPPATLRPPLLLITSFFSTPSFLPPFLASFLPPFLLVLSSFFLSAPSAFLLPASSSSFLVPLFFLSPPAAFFLASPASDLGLSDLGLSAGSFFLAFSACSCRLRGCKGPGGEGRQGVRGGEWTSSGAQGPGSRLLLVAA